MSRDEWEELHALCWEVLGACDGALAVRARGLGRKYGRRAQVLAGPGKEHGRDARATFETKTKTKRKP